MATPPGSARETADPLRWIALSVLLTGTLLDLLDATIINLAIPRIQRDIHASYSAVQWFTSGYTLTFSLGLITGGRLGDIFGRKRVFLLSMAGFTIASIVSGAANGPAMLIVARMLQGLTASMMVPQVLSIIIVTFASEESGKVFGLFGAVAGIGAVSGPIIGALLIQWNILGLEWRPIFLINVPIGITGVIMGWKYIRESKAPNIQRLDLIGVVLAALVLLMIMFPLIQGRELGWPAWTYASMAGSLVVLAIFILYERVRARTKGSPLVELSLFKIRSFSAGIGVQLIFGTVFAVFSLTGALYMQFGLGWTPLHAALTSLIWGAMVAVFATISVQKLVPRFGRKVLQAGALLMIVALVGYDLVARHGGVGTTTWELAAPLLVGGIGLGLIMAPLTSTVLSRVPFEHAGSASGLVNTMGQVGLSLGFGLASVTFFTVLDGTSASGRFGGQPIVHAFTDSLWWVIGGMAVVWVLMFALPKGDPRAQEVAPEQPTGENVAASPR